MPTRNYNIYNYSLSVGVYHYDNTQNFVCRKSESSNINISGPERASNLGNGVFDADSRADSESVLKWPALDSDTIFIEKSLNEKFGTCWDQSYADLFFNIL